MPLPNDQNTTTPDPSTLHHALVDELARDGHLPTPAVEAAFRAVPRHHFLPGVDLARVYRDEPIPTHEQNGIPISSSSQPAAMAIMLEQLQVRPGDRVLEIGAGTGYNAALLAHLAGPAGSVVAVDLDEEIVAEARAHLAAAGVTGVQVVQADGGLGHPSGAPYDRIALTVGAWDIALAWWRQLAPNGRLLVPLWLRGAQLTVAFEPAIDPAGQEHLASVNISGCAFMRLRGAFAGPEGYVAFGPDGALTVGVDDRAAVDPDALYHLLTGPAWELTADVPHGAGLGLWLALNDPAYCHIDDSGEEPLLPEAHRFLHVGGSYRASFGLLDGDALCLLVRTHETAPTSAAEDLDPAPNLLHVRCYGPDERRARAVGGRCLAHLRAWHAAGHPAFDTLRLRVYPLTTAPSSPAATLIPKLRHQIAIDWT